MNSDQFVRQQIQTGYSLHCHHGAWWKRQRPFYFKPAVQYQLLPPVTSHPHPLRALVGYSHLVPEGSFHNHAWPTMVVDWEDGREFALDNLAAHTSEKRSQIRRQVRAAFKELEIRLITSIDEVLDDLQQINISTAIRAEVGKPHDYYTRKHSQWESYMRLLFQFPDREWWGAFYQGKLIAYFYGYAIEREWIIDTAKSTTEFLHLRPNDGLLFKTMESAINKHHCTRINYGGWTPSDPKLTQFKQKHGFIRVDLPAYMKLNPLVSLMLRMGANPMKPIPQAQKATDRPQEEA